MKHGSTTQKVLFAFLAVALLAIPPASADGPVTGAQPPDGTAPPQPSFAEMQSPDAFGGYGQYTVFYAPKWTPRHYTPTPQAYDSGYVGPWNVDQSSYWVQIDLPNGASVDEIHVLVYDNDANGRWSLSFIGTEGAFPGIGTDTPFTIYITGGTTGDPADTPGYTVISPNFVVPKVIRTWTDLDSDGTESAAAYFLRLLGTQADDINTLRFWGALVHWSRTISPAPATATFSDVPTGHWAFQYIEALAASGISVGCGGGSFCPDNTLTRAQMAIFLAKALGLHWAD